MGDGRGVDPLGLGDLEGLEIAADVSADEGVKTDAGVGVVVFDEREGAEDADVEAGFLADFAAGAIGGRFSWLAFAAGELPETAEDGIGLSAADKECNFGRGVDVGGLACEAVLGGGGGRAEDDGDGDFHLFGRWERGWGRGLGIHSRSRHGNVPGQGMTGDLS
jgi:hypothetical protein